MSQKKIIFIDSVHEVLREKLEAAGFQCEMRFSDSREQLLKDLHQYFGIVLRSRIKVDKEFIDAASDVKFIARSGSGLENIDVVYATSKEIRVFNSPEGNRDAVGEHAIAMLLMLMNNLKRADAEVRRGEWNRKANEGREISGKTIGIIGYGIMGSSFGKKLAGFRCRILAHDKYKKGFTNSVVTESTLDEIHEHADIVSLHLPLTEETIHYADEKFFAAFSKPIYFINTARGKNVKTSALAEAIKSGKVLGACLDVLEYEKPSLEGLETTTPHPDLQYLLESDKVVLTPHIAGWSEESYYKLSDVLAQKIMAVFPSGV